VSEDVATTSCADVDISDIEFTLPTCHRHFFRGHRWWCRACRREANDQFREVCEVLWRVRRSCSHRWHNLYGGGRVCSRCCDRIGGSNGSEVER